MPARLLLGALVAVWFASAVAQDAVDPLGKGDAKLGEVLASRDCIACHARRFEGDADRIYLRADRKVRSPAQLMAQIRYCNTELGAGYFPDEEEHLGAYLNQRYYHFH
jgi:mono/diheme cytochrome c family protein